MNLDASKGTNHTFVAYITVIIITMPSLSHNDAVSFSFAGRNFLKKKKREKNQTAFFRHGVVNVRGKEA